MTEESRHYPLDAGLLKDGLRCSRKLYLKLRHDDFGIAPEPNYESRPEEGRRLCEEARAYFPGGVFAGRRGIDRREALEATRRLMNSGTHILYDAVFEHDGIIVPIDILARRDDMWEIVFVRQSTKLKDHHIDRAAATAWVMFHNGIEDYRATIMHVNLRCVWPDRANLFVRLDVTDRVHARAKEMPDHIARLRYALGGDRLPRVPIGRHCNFPRLCSFSEFCRREKKIPIPSVFELPRSRELAWKLYDRGILYLDDIPIKELNAGQKRALECYRTNREWIDRDGIRKALEQWRWPLHHIDFETISYAVPRYNGTSPHQQIPYQFSYHYQHGINKKLQHEEYLHDLPGDPREAVAERLVATVPSDGSVVAYNAQFEKTCLELLAASSWRHRDSLLDIAGRLVDPLPIFRAHVYHPGFLGSFSIKAIAPALVGEELSYKHLEIPNGMAAQQAFIRLVESDISEHDRIRLRNAMLTYCKQDTLAMVRIVEWLFNKAW